MSQLPKADLLTFWFLLFGLVLVMTPKGPPFISGSYGQVRCAFMFTLMMMISMGHHPAVLLGWSLAVSTQCFMTNHADLQVNIIAS